MKKFQLKIYEGIKIKFNFFNRFIEAFFAISWIIINFTDAKEFDCNFKNIHLIFEGTNDTFLTCEFVNAKFDSRESFKITSNHSAIEKISTVFNPNDDEPADDFVTQIKFKTSKISTIPNSIFKKFEHLQILDASNVEMKNINSLSFNGAGSLSMIFLHSNQLTLLNSFCFVHTKNLRILDLSNNKITTVDSAAFKALEKLETLSLSNNKISSLDDGTFEPLVSLKWIWLDRNYLTMISPNMLTKANQNLTGIYLNNNAITMISPYIFDRLKKLRFLMLAGNSCINFDFKNHVIEDNAGVKFEMRNCHKTYRRVIKSDEMKYNISHLFSLAEKANEKCGNESLNILETLNNVAAQITELERESRK